jgi:formamidopyrimidine-DNA glycosylase
MPEGLEAEIYRRAADRLVGREIGSVIVDALQPTAEELRDELPSRVVDGTRRRGKHVLLDLDDGRVLGLHFGMTGRLVVDGDSAIERLEYSSGRDDPAWDRLRIEFTDGSVVRVNDPRRWARFVLDPDLSRLGPDFMALTPALLIERLDGRRAALKAILLDQSVVAGFGNMCLDEILWQAGVSPLVPAGEVTPDQARALVTACDEHLPAMLGRGGSHTGTISPDVRAAVPPCPRDGGPLRREVVGGRTTVWCPVHQIG